MFRFILTSLGLGFAGFDPLGLMALIAALALGAKRRAVLALTGSMLATIVALTTASSWGGGPWIRRAGHWLHHLHGTVWASLLLVCGAAMVLWGAWRLHQGAPDNRHSKPEPSATSPRSTSDWAMATTGALVGASCLVDPAWYAVVFVAGMHRSPVHAIVAGLVWPATDATPKR